MASASRLNQLVGVRSDEVRTVWLFFFHNFFLGVGTILVYVSANVILLENHPETSLPIAYMASAVAMLGIGRVYAYFEHHLRLERLALRVLWSVVLLTAVIGLLVGVGHTVLAAVAIMAGYRGIYLLTNLEFWGVSAVVFDTRQGKRLFGLISAGDMPAKALGAILAALIHDHTQLLYLLLVAFAAFMGALYTLRLTLLAHEVHAPHQPARSARRSQRQWVQRIFGGSELVLLMCLSLGALATVATQIEFEFFINVKHKFHDQGTVIQYVGYVLALTYLLAMVVKVLLSRQVIDRFGVGRSLLVLPVVALLGGAGLEALQVSRGSETSLLVYFCGLYLVFEVIRRSWFDPVFLVLFQPLSPTQRLQGHTLAKGVYEPLGLGLAGLVLFLAEKIPGLVSLLPVGWILFLGGAVWLLRRTYQHYLHTLKDALERRFDENTQLALPTEALQLIKAQLQSPKSDEVGIAIEWLASHYPAALATEAVGLLAHPAALVRGRILEAIGAQNLPIAPATLAHQAYNDPAPALRQQAAYSLGRLVDAEADRLAPMLHHSDLHIRQGAIQGVLEIQSGNAAARRSLDALTQAHDTDSQRAALEAIGALHRGEYSVFVQNSLSSPDPNVVAAAIATASRLPDPALARALVSRLGDKIQGRAAQNSLRHLGAAAIPLLAEAARSGTDRQQAARIIGVAGGIPLPESRRLLTDLARRPDHYARALALRALTGMPRDTADAALFKQWVAEELRLAQVLLSGSLTEPHAELTEALDYELTVLIQRLFDLLAQLYDPEIIGRARVGVLHASRERRANALEILDNHIPRALYQTMQTLLDDVPLVEKVRLVQVALGPPSARQPIRQFILQEGQTLFSDWTLGLALRRWTPEGGAARGILPYLHHRMPLLRESAVVGLQLLSENQPIDFQQLIDEFPTIPSLLMSHNPATQGRIPDYERILILKNTSLFIQTPEAVLGSVTPIMKEVTCREGEVIFEKGDLGTCMYIIHSGTVHILDQSRLVVQFGKGDFFGELALLDAEARSATAVAATETRLFRLDQDDFYDLMEERGEVLRGIVGALCQRIRRQNQAVAAEVA